VTGSGSRRRLRVAFLGAGWIVPKHLAALERLDRAELVGVMSRTNERALATTAGRGTPTYTDMARLLDEQQPDVVYACTPPYRTPDACDLLIDRGIPFLVEKPLAARDGGAPPRIADAIDRSGLVVAVGYHWRGLDFLAEVRRRIGERPPELVLARWLDDTPGPDWWGRVDQGGGQVVEQATHLYDLARHLVGEAAVVGAASTPVPPPPSGRVVDVVGSTSATLRFASGAAGSFVNTRRVLPAVIELELISPDLRTTIRLATERETLSWDVAFTEPSGVHTVTNERDPYEVQSEAFLDAVEANDPSRVLATYRDALATDRLTRSVVAAAGVAG
jgi:myo-inositol 2-dehydrogenase / D-chiro-inositol 1-dehydrogenase